MWKLEFHNILNLNPYKSFQNYFISVEPPDSVISLLSTSTILGDDIDLVQQLVEWMGDKKFRWQLCYQASRDGWRSADFHGKCDQVAPTVTLVKCGANVFGGYTDQSWKLSLVERLMAETGVLYNSYFLTLHCCI